MPQNKVSVIIPWAGAGEALLLQQLYTLWVQSYRGEFEIVLSCNTVEALSKAEDIQALFPNIVLVDSTKEMGVSFARNCGASQSSGNKILFCDADDFVSSNWVQELSDGLDVFDFVASTLDYSKLNGRKFDASDARSKARLNIPLNFIPMAPGGASGFTREAFIAVDGFNRDSLFTEDIDISWRLQLAGRSLGFMDKAVLYYRLETKFGNAFRKHYKYGIAMAKLTKTYNALGAKVTWRVTFRDVSKCLLAVFIFFPFPQLRVKSGYIWGLFLGKIRGSMKYRVKGF
jgi:GT2 family glycosyltransferase